MWDQAVPACGDHRHLIGHGCGGLEAQRDCGPPANMDADLLPSEDHAAQGLASPPTPQGSLVPDAPAKAELLLTKLGRRPRRPL